MPEPQFQIDITERLVRVRMDATSQSPKGRFRSVGLNVALFFVVMVLGAFLPGRHNNPSIWHEVVASGFDPRTIALFAMIFAMLFVPFVLFLVAISWRYFVESNPSNELFECDQATLTFSRVPWLDRSNSRWVTQRYSVRSVKDIRYRAIAAFRASIVYGLRFKADGKTLRVLPGISTRDADRVLKALKALGADVPDDPELVQTLKHLDFEDDLKRRQEELFKRIDNAQKRR